jgi:hypothetical protein
LSLDFRDGVGNEDPVAISVQIATSVGDRPWMGILEKDRKGIKRGASQLNAILIRNTPTIFNLFYQNLHFFQYPYTPKTDYIHQDGSTQLHSSHGAFHVSWKCRLGSPSTYNEHHDSDCYLCITCG